MMRATSKLEGIILCIAIGGLAWAMANFIPHYGKLIGGPVFALVLGMGLSSFNRPARLEPGIKFSGKKILQYSIVFIGFRMNIGAIIQTGSQSLLLIGSVLLTAFVVAFFVGKSLKISPKVTTLIGVGTAICGGSAIAATAPILDADDKETAYAISTIFLFNILAVLFFPMWGRILNLSDLNFGFWAGAAINDTSSVVAAGYSFSKAAGDYATIVKLTRTLMIIPVTLFLAGWQMRKLKSKEGSRTFNWVQVFPWFVLGFLGAAMINSIGILPPFLTKVFNELGGFGIMIAMAGIGLNTNLKGFIRHGLRPILLGLSCWVAVAMVSLMMQLVF